MRAGMSIPSWSYAQLTFVPESNLPIWIVASQDALYEGHAGATVYGYVGLIRCLTSGLICTNEDSLTLPEHTQRAGLRVGFVMDEISGDFLVAIHDRHYFSDDLYMFTCLRNGPCNLNSMTNISERVGFFRASSGPYSSRTQPNLAAPALLAAPGKLFLISTTSNSNNTAVDVLQQTSTCSALVGSGLTSMQTCQTCAPGTMADQTSSMCTLCPEGTFAPSEGAVSCEACPIGKFCPAGASAPLLDSIASPGAGTLFNPSKLTVRSKPGTVERLSLWGFVSVLVLLVLLTILIAIVLAFASGRGPMRSLLKTALRLVDFWFRPGRLAVEPTTLAQHGGGTPSAGAYAIVRKRSLLGGLVSLWVCLLGIMVVVVLSAQFSLNNVIFISSQNAGINARAGPALRPRVRLSVTYFGGSFAQSCFNLTASGLTCASPTAGATPGKAHLTCSQPSASACLAVWQCDDCASVGATQATVVFQFAAPFAAALELVVEVTPVDADFGADELSSRAAIFLRPVERATVFQERDFFLTDKDSSAMKLEAQIYQRVVRDMRSGTTKLTYGFGAIEPVVKQLGSAKSSNDTRLGPQANVPSVLVTVTPASYFVSIDVVPRSSTLSFLSAVGGALSGLVAFGVIAIKLGDALARRCKSVNKSTGKPDENNGAPLVSL